MKKCVFVGILCVSLTVLPLLQAKAADNQTQQRGTVSVSYSVEQEISPDTVEFSVAIKTSDKKSMQEASTKNKEISNRVYEYFKSNINTSNGDYIKTSNYSASPVYVYNNGKRIFDKYEVSNNIVVHTKSLDKVSGLIDKSIQLGATNVNSLNFSLSNKDAKCVDLLSKAASQARTRANNVAAAVGTSITGIQNVRTSCSLNQRRVNYGYSNMKLMMAAGTEDAAAEAPSTAIEAGNITIYANIDADFYVK